MKDALDMPAEVDFSQSVPNPFFHKLHIIPSALIDVITDEQAEAIAQEVLAAYENGQTVSRPNPHYRSNE